MKWTFSSLGLIMIGICGFVVILLFNELTVSNEQDYYTLKDATEAAMIESIDIAYYRLTGELKMSQEKFVESFTKRFTETSTYGEGNYDVIFNQISETPPKVSLQIVDATQSYNIYNSFSVEVDATQLNIANKISAILDVYK